MKFQPSAPESQTSALKRRGVLLGSGVAAVAGVTALVASRSPLAVAPEAPVVAAKAAPADGYQLTQHVLRYYETTRV